MHRVRSGDTLGAIALRYNSTVSAIRNANRLRGSLLRIGQVLSVPLVLEAQPGLRTTKDLPVPRCFAPSPQMEVAASQS